MSNIITPIIQEVCKNLGIEYTSPYLDEVKKDYKQDVHKLSQIYLQLRSIIADLSDIEEKYKGINGVVGVFESAIQELENLDHILIKEAIKISKGGG